MKSFAILALSLFTSSYASAGLLLEPHLGYTMAGSKSGSFSALAIGSKSSGVAYGARAGYQFLGVMGGLNYQHASLTIDTTIPSVNSSTVTTSYGRNSLGLFVGFNAPILLRAWLGYNFSEKETASETNSHFDNGDYFKGTSTELGLGFTGFPFLSLNLVYKMYNYSKAFTSSNGQTASGSMKPTEIQLQVSAPFNLF